MKRQRGPGVMVVTYSNNVTESVPGNMHVIRHDQLIIWTEHIDGPDTNVRYINLADIKNWNWEQRA